MQTPRLQIILVIVAIALAIATATACYALLPRWQTLYAQLGFELPLGTRLALSIGGWIALYPLTVLAAGMLWPRPHDRGAAALAWAAVAGLLLAIGLLWALALPFAPL